jgi:hypothetical protein
MIVVAEQSAAVRLGLRIDDMAGYRWRWPAFGRLGRLGGGLGLGRSGGFSTALGATGLLGGTLGFGRGSAWCV